MRGGPWGVIVRSRRRRRGSQSLGLAHSGDEQGRDDGCSFDEVAQGRHVHSAGQPEGHERARPRGYLHRGVSEDLFDHEGIGDAKHGEDGQDSADCGGREAHSTAREGEALAKHLSGRGEGAGVVGASASARGGLGVRSCGSATARSEARRAQRAQLTPGRQVITRMSLTTAT